MNISKRGTIDDEDHGGDVDDRFVCHHVDYASKALERRTELDELRKKALAKNKGMECRRSAQACHHRCHFSNCHFSNNAFNLFHWLC